MTEDLLSPILKGCAELEAAIEGKQAYTIKAYILVITEEAHFDFNEMPQRDAIAKNHMINGLCQWNLTMDVVELFEGMPRRNTAL